MERYISGLEPVIQSKSQMEQTRQTVKDFLHGNNVDDDVDSEETNFIFVLNFSDCVCGCKMRFLCCLVKKNKCLCLCLSQMSASNIIFYY